jgi:RimJ/RimL family protein N-acetyltransferase
MMRAVFGQDQLVADYISNGIGEYFSPPYVGIGFTRNGRELCGGALFNNWTGSNIDVSIYGPGAMTRYALGIGCRYAFKQINANRITARTKRSNKTMQRLLPRIGFTFEGSLKRYYGPARMDDALIYALFIEGAEKWMQ